MWGSLKMARKKNKLKKPKRKKILMLLVAALLVLAVTGYSYRHYISAYMYKGDAVPGSGELPLTDAEPDPPDELPEPDEDKVDEEIVPPPLPKPDGEPLHIADGDYLLALVNRNTTLGSYAPRDIVPVPMKMNHIWQYNLRLEARDQLVLMGEAARADGVELKVISAYRSYGTQSELFRDYASRYGDEKANTFSARAGQSEHQLGTAVDFGGTSSDKTQAFADTAAGRWLAEHAYKYGFAMSYPESSSDITGYIYEPWHFRYIGVEAAAAWKESGLVLLQYLERQPQTWLD